jgi:hypothetical protein
MVLHHGWRPVRSIRDGFAPCAGFAVLLLLGAAAWVGVFMVLSRS